MIQRVKEALERVEHVSTTVDAWFAYNKSFLGMKAHWIHPVTLRRCKAALACTRITGRHTYDVFHQTDEIIEIVWFKAICGNIFVL